MKRFEFICKGKQSRFIEALTEEAARIWFEQNNRYNMEIIDVIEVPIPAPIDPSSFNNMKLEGFERTDSEIKPTTEAIEALAASTPNDNKIGY